MAVNNAENGVGDALTNEIQQIRQDFNEFRTNPQPVGIGSVQLATYIGMFTWSGAYITPGGTFYFYVDLATTTYNDLPTVNTNNLVDLLIDVRIDVDDAAHSHPFGSALTSTQWAMISVYHDLYHSMPFSNSYGFRRVYVQITNSDPNPHTYYLRANVAMLRPKLKKL